MYVIWLGDHEIPPIIKKRSIGYFILIKGQNIRFRCCDNAFEQHCSARY